MTSGLLLDTSLFWARPCSFVGSFVDGEFDGFGKRVMSNPDGGGGEEDYDNYEEVYEGDWKCGQRNGSGTYQFPNGNKYKGEFWNGDFHGSGRLTRCDGFVVHDGEWKDDKPLLA